MSPSYSQSKNFKYQTTKFILSLLLILYANIPHCSCQVYQANFSLEDNTPKGHTVGNVPKAVTLPSVPFSNIVEPISHNWENFFETKDNGSIVIKKTLDRDSKSVCQPLGCCSLPECLFKASYLYMTEPATYTVTINIRIQDKNDNKPVFTPSNMNLTITEHSQSAIQLGLAEDIDSSQNQVKRYQIVDASNTFNVVDTGHSLTLTLLKDLDYDNPDYPRVFQVLVLAIDGGNPPLTGTLKLTIRVTDANDNSPQFNQTEFNINISEGVVSENPIIRMMANDRDSGENGRVTYSFGELTQSSAPKNKFLIDSVTGDVSLLQPLDYENHLEKSFWLTVTAADHGPIPKTATATLSVTVIDINDNDPGITVLQNNSVVEELDMTNKIVLKLVVHDADLVSTSKVNCNAGESMGLKLVQLSKTSFNVYPTAIFDYEKIHFLWIVIRCEDLALPTRTSTSNLTVAVLDVNDNRPVFDQERYIVDVYEDRGRGENIFNVSAKEADSGIFGRISYRLGPRANPWFSIYRDTGQIIINKELDRETTPEITFTVIAEDGGYLNATSEVRVVLLDVNDNNPRLVREPKLAVVEDSPRDTVIGRVEFVDDDLGSSGVVVLSVGEFSNATVNRFLRLEKDGRVITKAPVDRESYANLFLEVVASDRGLVSRSTTVTLSIRVLDINDHAPTLGYPPPDTTVGYSPTIYTNTKWHSPVVTLQATDPDQGENGTVTYKMRTSNATGYFQINQTSGLLYTTWTELDPPREGLYSIKVELTDLGKPSLTKIGQFYVNVGMASENPDSVTGASKNPSALRNVVILGLIVGFSIALGITLIAAIVWVRSRSAHLPNGSVYTDCPRQTKVSDDPDHLGYAMESYNMEGDIGLNSYKPPVTTFRDSHMFTMPAPGKRGDPVHLQTFGNGDDVFHSNTYAPPLPAHQRHVHSPTPLLQDRLSTEVSPLP